jgi:hypothetical protein
MKTKENSIKKSWSRGIGFFLALAVVIAGCTSIDAPVGTDDNGVKSFEDLNINVKYAESYDQTTVTFSRHWPNSISTSLAKNVEGGGELMIDYERVHEVIAFDEDGYMSSTLEFLEGDSEMGMPESVYEQVKAEMPAKDPSDNPVAKIVMTDGLMRQYGKDGTIKSEFPIDKEALRIDPEWLEVLRDSTSDEGNTQNTIKNNIRVLEDSGIKYSVVNGFYAKYEMPPSPEGVADGVSKQEYVRDLRNGNIISYAELNAKGEYLNVTESRYSTIEGIPVLKHEVYYTFGNVNGHWGISERSVMTRENIQIIIN